jgi:Icc protein
MPIYLPPISRRRFLSRTLAAAAGLALGPKLFGAEKSTDENFWALFSDPHIAADRAQINRTVNMADNLASVVREVIALPSRPAGVLVNGDCAWNSGEKEDYATFAGLVEPLRKDGMPVHLTLGNHDNREHFWDALEAEKTAKRPLADKQAMMISTPRANWFVLDSLEKTLSAPGILGEEQLDWLAKSLDANSDKPALVMVHHDPGAGAKTSGLKDTEALFKIIRPRKQVKVYFFGHTHNWSVSPDVSGIHLINLPPTGYVFEAGRPSGWVRATLANDGMKIELRCVDQKHPAHGEAKELKWRA